MINMLLSNRLGERRMSQYALAKKTGIRPATISSIYNETTKSISLEHLDLICEVLECDICDLLTRSADKVEQAEKAARYLYATKDKGFMDLMTATAARYSNQDRKC